MYEAMHLDLVRLYGCMVGAASRGSCDASQAAVLCIVLPAQRQVSVDLCVCLTCVCCCLLCVLQLEQDLSNPAAPLTAATAYEDVLSMLRNTAIRCAHSSTHVHIPMLMFSWLFRTMCASDCLRLRT
jgi:hypothetical protein